MLKKVSILLSTIIIIELVLVPMVKAEKVLVIGIDGATFDLILPWAQRGDLPNFKKMMDNGVYSKLQSELPYISPVMWTSFYTGQNPGGHGIFEFLRRSKDSYEMIPVTYDDVTSKAVWDILGENNKRSIVINIPMTYPPRQINGIMVSGYESPEGYIFTYPENLTEELIKKGYIIEPMKNRFTPGNEEELLNNINASLEKRSEISLEMMKKNNWDFFMVVFTESDRIQHYFWDHMENKDKYGNAILNFYEKLDTKIGKFLDAVDENTTVILMSDHGFGPLKGEVYINWWLAENGFLKFKSPIIYWTIKLGLTQQNIVTFLKKIHVFNFLETFTNKTGLDFKKSLASPNYESIDFHNTKAYAAQFGGGVYINLKDREPYGVVSQEDYERVRADLINALSNLKNPKNDEKFFPGVYRPEDLYGGQYIDLAPDITIGTDAYDPVGWIGYNIIYDTAIKSGNHREYGILVIYNKESKKTIEYNISRIIDVAPTILKLMNISTPHYMDGRPLI